MNCLKCGSPINANEIVCRNCGTPVPTNSVNRVEEVPVPSKKEFSKRNVTVMILAIIGIIILVIGIVLGVGYNNNKSNKKSSGGSAIPNAFSHMGYKIPYLETFKIKITDDNSLYLEEADSKVLSIMKIFQGRTNYDIDSQLSSIKSNIEEKGYQIHSEDHISYSKINWLYYVTSYTIFGKEIPTVIAYAGAKDYVVRLEIFDFSEDGVNYLKTIEKISKSVSETVSPKKIVESNESFTEFDHGFVRPNFLVNS